MISNSYFNIASNQIFHSMLKWTHYLKKMSFTLYCTLDSYYRDHYIQIAIYQLSSKPFKNAQKCPGRFCGSILGSFTLDYWKALVPFYRS